MCRLLGWVAREPVTVRDVLGDDGLTAFRRLASLHADGWGMACDGADGPVLERSTLRADTDPAFAAACTTRAARAGIVHLRWATPGLPVAPENTHPFRCGPRSFAHNGAIHPVDRVEEIVAPPWRDRLAGTTDSERYFLAVLAELDVPGTDLPTALSRVTARLTAEFQPSSLNALLSTPTALHAVNCHDPAAAPIAGPPVAGAAAEVAVVDTATYFDLWYREAPDAVVVASSGFVPPRAGGWQLLPNDTVLVIDRGTLATRQVRLNSGLGAAPAVPAARAG